MARARAVARSSRVMRFEVRAARGEFDVVDRETNAIVCGVQASSAPGFAGTPAAQLALSPDARWIALWITWDLAGLAFVVDAAVRGATLDEALVTLDTSVEPPVRWTADGQLRAWTRREDTGQPCWCAYDPARAQWTSVDADESAPVTAATIALASAHRAPLSQRAAILEAAPREVCAEVTRVLDHRAAKERFYRADPRRDAAGARAIYAQVIAMAPEWSEPHRALVALLDDAQQWNAMADACAAWRAAIPSDPRALAERAAAALRLGAVDACAQWLDELERAHGDARGFMDNEAFDDIGRFAQLARWR